ncbi:MAG: TetR/AcrR family transcriptional regulator [Solirubrobacteraceae bacterium]
MNDERETAAERPARSRVPRPVREREMLEVAGQLFGERGYHNVSMDEIAQAAGVSKPMVYAYFESKEGLFLACVELATTELVATVEEVTPVSLAQDIRLWRGLLAVFTFIEENRESWMLLYPHGPQSGGPFAAGAARANAEMGRLLTGIFREAAATEGIDAKLAAAASEPIAHALVAAVVGLGSWWMRHPEQPKELQALRLMNLAWVGLGDLSRGKLWMAPPEG